MTDTLIDSSSNRTSQHQQIETVLAPLFTWRGTDVYPIFGAEGEGEGEGEPNSDSDTGTDEDAGEGSKEGDENAVTRAEFDQLRKQLSASDKRRDEAEKKLKDLDDAKKDELTKVTERAEAAEKLIEKQTGEIAKMRLENAFLTADTGITWHDPGDALALAERKGYLAEVVGEDGKVDASKLKSKLSELAKASPHLVKTSDGETGKGKDPKTPTGTKVGSKPGSSGTGGDKVPSRYDRFINR